MNDRSEWHAFERELLRHDDLTIAQKLNLLDAMHAEAIALGVFPPKDPLEGIEVDIRVAKAVNRVSRAA